jgi:peptidoglycan/LPS O-acetylase OafA/YrhL
MTLTRSARRQYVDFRGGDGRSLPHLSGLDGLRGLAVAGVVLFHTDLGLLVGGYLGVSTFFTLSGFLITSLLLREVEDRGAVSLRNFWGRRFRRLLPASTVTLFLVATAFAWWVATAQQLEDLRVEVLAALGQVANWQLILSGSSYGDLFAAPSPVLHFWSLAIEEQFYLLFPALLMGIWAVGRGSKRVLAAALALLALASAAEPFIFQMSQDRIYFGTDTRAAELLLGALLAMVLGERSVRRRLVTPGWERTAVVLGGLAGLVLQLYWWVTLEQSSEFLYSGGLTIYALISCLVIASASLPGAALEAPLSLGVLTYLGRRSYGIYLVHWPIFLVLRQTVGSWSPWLLALVGIVISILVAEASYRLLEQPIRRGSGVVSRHFARSAVAAIAVVAVAALLLPTDSADPEGRLDFDAAQSQQEELLARQREAPTTTAAPAQPPTPKLATFGDSTALLMGLGMLQYAAETGAILGEPGDATLGCGVSRFEQRRVDEIFGYTEECTAWPERWAQAIDTQQPNIAQLITGSWEVTDALLPGAEDFSAIGDPAVDDFIRSELLTAVDVLGADGAMVLLVLWPQFSDSVSAGASPGERAKADPARMQRLHELMREIAELRPDTVRVLDMQSMLADRLQDEQLRPDGIHIPADAAYQLYQEELGPETLRLWEDFWREKYAALVPDETTSGR